MKFFLDCIAVLRTAELMVEVFRIAFGEGEETFKVLERSVYAAAILTICDMSYRPSLPAATLEEEHVC